MTKRTTIRAIAAGAETISPRPQAEERLPPGCPVTALGVHGDTCYYLDAAQQLRPMAAKDHSRLGILKLFAPHDKFLYDTWPRMDKGGEITGWRPERAAECLMAAASERGIWDPSGRERGRGAWPGERGELVLHCGQRVLTVAPNERAWGDRIERPPGLIGRYVYPAGEAAGIPASEPAPVPPGQDLLELLETWHWKRASIDPVLLLGWIGAAIIGGALDWRPMVWITGSKGTGKSTLHELLDSVMGGTLLKLADASEAHIRQTLRHQTLPVLLDESEPEEDNRKLYALVKLARIAASGGTMGRGGSDHQAVEFTMRSAFCFGSILIPPLLGQDRSRIAVLDMGALAPDAARPDVSAERWGAVGAQLRRRMLDCWGRWDATLDWYRAELGRAGHTKRGQDQLGTLLAAADCLLFDGSVNAHTGGEWVSHLRAADLAELDDDDSDERRCVDHLLSQTVDPFRNGSRKSVAQWVRAAAAMDGASPDQQIQAQDVLQTYGLRLRMIVKDGAREPPTLAVANYHSQLAALFEGTHWAGRSGSMGVWVQALRRLPGAERAGAVYFAGHTAKATTVPLDVLVPRRDTEAQGLA